MRLESGPAAYDRNYNLVILLVSVVLGAYFLYDYQIGYPKKNREAARKALIPHLGAENIPETFSDFPTQPDIAALKERLIELAKTRPIEPADIHDALGPPLISGRGENGSEVVEYYVSKYGRAQIPVVRNRIMPEQIQWMAWDKSKDEIRLQLYCALVAFAFALYMLTRVYRAATLRVVIDDDGMTYGKRRIAFENMVRLCDYSRKGWVDLYYRLGPQERKLRIDNQKVRKFDEIIDTLCAARGFEDPRQVAATPATPEPSSEPPESSGPVDSVDSDARQDRRL